MVHVNNAVPIKSMMIKLEGAESIVKKIKFMILPVHNVFVNQDSLEFKDYVESAMLLRTIMHKVNHA